LRAVVVERSHEIVGARISREDGAVVTALQVAAVDDGAAADVLHAAAGGEQELRLANVPPDEPPSHALEELGARQIVRQHEMRLRLF
jgi:hypothetical protein